LNEVSEVCWSHLVHYLDKYNYFHSCSHTFQQGNLKHNKHVACRPIYALQIITIIVIYFRKFTAISF
jgi:hypothetical protein